MKNGLFHQFPKAIPLVISALVGMGGAFSPAWAGDPFRATNTEAIGVHTEAAFKALFQTGDYPTATQELALAAKNEGNEPLVYAMEASIAYLQEDWTGVRSYGEKTLAAGQALVTTSPVRGHLYTAIGHLMEGAYVLSPQGEGSLKGVPTALGKLQQAYGSLSQAKSINAVDPELNLIQGFMELMIALYLPLANPDQAMAQLETYAAPSYLADWGRAIGFRDLDRYPEAFSALDRAMQDSTHPQLYYLRAQVWVRQGIAQKDSANFIQAQTDFRRALARSSQLPKRLVAQIFREYCRNQIRIDGNDRDCGALRQPILTKEGNWGPNTLPAL
jgi:tetratricopeptide (TPR) repeat protein